MQEDYFKEYENLEVYDLYDFNIHNCKLSLKFQVHELMLRDRPRQEAYKNAIISNSALFKDKIVLDVGAGTGILSAFCAKAGAKLVYAVEASNLAKIALKVMEENKLTSVVKVIKINKKYILKFSYSYVDI